MTRAGSRDISHVVVFAAPAGIDGRGAGWGTRQGAAAFQIHSGYARCSAVLSAVSIVRGVGVLARQVCARTELALACEGCARTGLNSCYRAGLHGNARQGRVRGVLQEGPREAVAAGQERIGRRRAVHAVQAQARCVLGGRALELSF